MNGTAAPSISAVAVTSLKTVQPIKKPPIGICRNRDSPGISGSELHAAVVETING